MWYKLRTYIWVVSLALSLGVQAQELSEEARISLITCTPGEELYARYGHTALRVCDPKNDIDIAFNYGIFDFNTDHFYWKFVRGETWYQLGATPYRWFMREYEMTNRPVYEQVLNLSAEDKEILWQKLVDNYRPENRQYLYNFVFDNCATRPYVMLMSVLCRNSAEMPYSTYRGAEGQTYRRFIQHYTPKGSWADFGINLLFGPKADRKMQGEERLFLPEELMGYISQTVKADGQPLVANEQIAPFAIQAVPWYATWYFGIAALFVALAVLSYYDRRRGQRAKWVDWILYTVYALLLILVTFLTFFSCHPLVGFGWRLLILPMTHLCARLVYIVR